MTLVLLSCGKSSVIRMEYGGGAWLAFALALAFAIAVVFVPAQVSAQETCVLSNVQCYQDSPSGCLLSMCSALTASVSGSVPCEQEMAECRVPAEMGAPCDSQMCIVYREIDSTLVMQTFPPSSEPPLWQASGSVQLGQNFPPSAPEYNEAAAFAGSDGSNDGALTVSLAALLDDTTRRVMFGQMESTARYVLELVLGKSGSDAPGTIGLKVSVTNGMGVIASADFTLENAMTPADVALPAVMLSFVASTEMLNVAIEDISDSGLGVDVDALVLQITRLPLSSPLPEASMMPTASASTPPLASQAPTLNPSPGVTWVLGAEGAATCDETCADVGGTCNA